MTHSDSKINKWMLSDRRIKQFFYNGCDGNGDMISNDSHKDWQ